MARYMEDDPFMAAAAELIEDVKIKRAEDEGRVWRPEPGVHVVNDDGEFVEYVGTHDAVVEQLTEVYANGYQEAYEEAYQQAYTDALERFLDDED